MSGRAGDRRSGYQQTRSQLAVLDRIARADITVIEVADAAHRGGAGIQRIEHIGIDDGIQHFFAQRRAGCSQDLILHAASAQCFGRPAGSEQMRMHVDEARQHIGVVQIHHIPAVKIIVIGNARYAAVLNVDIAIRHFRIFSAADHSPVLQNIFHEHTPVSLIAFILHQFTGNGRNRKADGMVRYC